MRTYWLYRSWRWFDVLETLAPLYKDGGASSDRSKSLLSDALFVLYPPGDLLVSWTGKSTERTEKSGMAEFHRCSEHRKGADSQFAEQLSGEGQLWIVLCDSVWPHRSGLTVEEFQARGMSKMRSRRLDSCHLWSFHTIPPFTSNPELLISPFPCSLQADLTLWTGSKGDIKNTVDPRNFLQWQKEISRMAKNQGFETLNIHGMRVSGSTSANPGKIVDYTIDLTKLKWGKSNE